MVGARVTNRDHTIPDRKRWLIAISGVLMQLCLGTIYAWSIFKIPIMTTHGWSETQTQAPFMVYGAVFAIAVAVGGALVDRVEPRIIGMLGGFLFAAGIFLGGVANEVQSIVLLIVAYGFLAGLGGGFGYVTPIATLIRWFPEKRGFITGLAVMGYGLGSFIMGIIGPYLIMNLGIARTFYIWGGVSLVVTLTAGFTLKNPPADWALQVHTSSASTTVMPHSFTLREALGSSRLWILGTMLFVSMSAGLGVISQLSPMAQDVMIKGHAGMMTEDDRRAIVLASGTVVAVAGLFNGLGRLAWAWVSDIIGRTAVFAIIFISLLMSFCALAMVNTIITFAGLIFYILACYGGTLASMPALAADEFGHEHIGKIYGFIFLASGFACICGPYMFATIKGLTGTFTHALYAESALSAFGLMLVLILKNRQRGRAWVSGNK